jgi:hypothetical protein
MDPISNRFYVLELPLQNSIREDSFMDGSAAGSLVVLAMALGICLAVFLILRALVLWYFRIGEIVTLLKSINERLGQIGGDKVPAPPATHLN